MSYGSLQSRNTRETQALYWKIKAQYVAHKAAFTDGVHNQVEKSRAVEEARAAFAEATAVVERYLEVTHHIRLGHVLRHAVFQYEVSLHLSP